MIVFTQGDEIELDLECQNFDLTGATLTTYMKAADGSTVSFPNGQHTIDPDQDTNRGKFKLDLSSDDTGSVGAGSAKEIITKVVQSSTTMYFHGRGVLTVLPAKPVT